MPDRKTTNITSKQPKADPNDPSHVPSPMPGTVGSVAVQAGHQVKAGDLLLVIEAMKMETAINAEQDGTVRKVLVSAGSQVDAKDLLIELDPA